MMVFGLWSLKVITDFDIWVAVVETLFAVSILLV
jgi:hypothetical protein